MRIVSPVGMGFWKPGRARKYELWAVGPARTS